MYHRRRRTITEQARPLSVLHQSTCNPARDSRAAELWESGKRALVATRPPTPMDSTLSADGFGFHQFVRRRAGIWWPSKHSLVLLFPHHLQLGFPTFSRTSTWHNWPGSWHSAGSGETSEKQGH